MAEGAPLLRVYTLTRIEGSNPSLSANLKHQVIDFNRLFPLAAKTGPPISPPKELNPIIQRILQQVQLCRHPCQ